MFQPNFFAEEILENDYDIIIVHYLSLENARIIVDNEKPIPIIWFFWGQDGFNLSKFHGKIFTTQN